jgi:hypothetical protein
MTDFDSQFTGANGAGFAPQGLGSHWCLSPSDLTFLWEGCRACFYNKIVHKIYPPRTPMPAIFSHIDGAMKRRFMGRRIEAVVPTLPGGEIMHADEWVESARLAIPGKKASIKLRGRFDTVVLFDDGSYGVLDYKTSDPKAAHVALYARQLHAYALAMERPASGRPRFSPVTRLGLLAFQPRDFVHREGAANGIDGFFGGGLHWCEIPRSDEAFFTFLAAVVTVLETPQAPPSSPACAFCAYRGFVRHPSG